MRSMEQEVLRMFDKNYYDVTNWDTGNPYEDIGEVLNSIIACLLYTSMWTRSFNVQDISRRR